jgi:chromate transport protein ChrA
MQYQELFALCQALPGPGSTKMLYCINVIHAGLLPGIVSFFIWRRVWQRTNGDYGTK